MCSREAVYYISLAHNSSTVTQICRVVTADGMYGMQYTMYMKWGSGKLIIACMGVGGLQNVKIHFKCSLHMFSLEWLISRGKHWENNALWVLSTDLQILKTGFSNLHCSDFYKIGQYLVFKYMYMCGEPLYGTVLDHSLPFTVILLDYVVGS